MRHRERRKKIYKQIENISQAKIFKHAKLNIIDYAAATLVYITMSNRAYTQWWWVEIHNDESMIISACCTTTTIQQFKAKSCVFDVIDDTSRRFSLLRFEYHTNVNIFSMVG